MKSGYFLGMLSNEIIRTLYTKRRSGENVRTVWLLENEC